MVSYKELSKFTHNEIKELLKLAGHEIYNFYNSNRSALATVLNNYHGPNNYEAIANYLRPQQENDIFDIQPGLYTTTQRTHEERLREYEAQPDIFRMRPNLYTTTQRTHEERKKAYDEMENALKVKPGIYTKQQTPREERLREYENAQEAREQIKKAFDVIKTINGKPLNGEQWIIRNNDKAKAGERRITFNLREFDETNKKYFCRHISQVLTKLINKIGYNHKWLCAFTFEGSTITHARTLSEEHIHELLSQMKREGFIQSIEEKYADLQEDEYDFFASNIRNLETITFYDYSDYPELNKEEMKRSKERKNNFDKDPVYQALINSGASDKVIEQYKKTKRKAEGTNKKGQYHTRDGKFWKYTLNIPLNLERYMIFNKVDKKTAEIMTRDNCFIYACIQSGLLNEDEINHMREIIRVKSFPQSKIQIIANELNIIFKVNLYCFEEETHNKSYTYTPENKQEAPQGAEAPEGRESEANEHKEENPKQINLLLIDGHYMLNEYLNMSSFFIEHYEEIIKMCPSWTIDKMSKIYMFDKGKPKIRNNIQTPILNIIKACFKSNRFTPIVIGDVITYSSLLYKEDLKRLEKLEYDARFCTRLKKPYEDKKEDKKDKFIINQVVYADFECSTDGIHKAFNICYESSDGILKGSIWGENCAEDFLDKLPDYTLIYYHNLSYDINFVISKLSAVVGTPIIKGSRTMTIQGTYKARSFMFKDSYTIISKPLKMFPEMFQLKTGPKEVFPYTYYSSDLLKNDNRVGIISDAIKHVSDKETFINNINTIKGCKIDNDKFDLEKYSTYYCSQDVRILKEGFERFRKDLLEAFNLDAYDFVSICSIANKYFEHNVYFPNGNLYDLANTPREFISRCVQGGRCMLADNEKQINEDMNNKIVDFDAVSLYPSAIARLYTLEGKPKVLTNNMLSVDYLLKHLFTDDQEKPTSERFISAFYVEIVIKSIGIKRHFPCVVVDEEFNPEFKDVPRSSNTCCRMFVNHISLQDLINFQKCDIEIVRGYYYNGKRDLRIRDEVRKLFELRLKYKKEGNPLQEVIKLILNSIYGKTILKPIETKISFIDNQDATRFLIKNYNSILEFENLYDSDKTIFKQLKPIVRHFNFCPLGVDILAMSKRIMNEVFCLAEDNNMKIFYQDTDSGHYYEKDISILQKLFKEKYGRELIGKNLGQFHSDFAEVDKGHESKAYKSIFVGKKTYIDMLSNDLNNIAFHCRMKGIKQDVIAIKANELFPESVKVEYDEASGIFRPIGKYDFNSKFSVMELYKKLYNGDEVEFDLCSGKNPCFDKKNNFTIITKSSFIRKLKF